MLYFFEKGDAALLEDLIPAPLKAYGAIIGAAAPAPSADDIASMKNNRKKIIDWMLTQDYGVKISRQNNIPMEVIEAYGFPPVNL